MKTAHVAIFHLNYRKFPKNNLPISYMNNWVVLYVVRCVIVLYNAKKGKQSHIFNASKKTLNCLAFACDGKHLVSGEVCNSLSDSLYCLQYSRVVHMCACVTKDCNCVLVKACS